MLDDHQISHIQDDLRAKGISYCIGAYVDIHGIPKGKVVPLSHLSQMLKGSERYTGYALDGLGQRPHDDEITSVPDTNLIIQIPWAPSVAWMPADNEFQGEPYSLSTRVALKNVLNQAVQLGYGMNLGIESEVYLLKKDADGTLSVPNAEDKQDKPCYDVRGFLGQFTWLDKMAKTMEHLGWDLYSFDHEDGNSQFEFDFAYADALTSCDRYIFFRLMAKHFAAEEDLVATTMPKPFANKTGTGAHFNISLYDKETGHNVFACSPETDPRGLGLTSLGYKFVAGILKHGRALCVAFGPTVNSYKRLIRQGEMNLFSWAPVFNSYGSNNRTNSIRIPSGGGRCELRNVDGSVNPYLAATLALAAGLEGIREDWDPGSPNDDNLYEMTEMERLTRHIEFLPRNLFEALEAFAADPLIEKTLGTSLRDEFLTYKRHEWEDYHRSISKWEIDRYSDMF